MNRRLLYLLIFVCLLVLSNKVTGHGLTDFIEHSLIFKKRSRGEGSGESSLITLVGYVDFEERLSGSILLLDV